MYVVVAHRTVEHAAAVTELAHLGFEGWVLVETLVRRDPGAAGHSVQGIASMRHTDHEPFNLKGKTALVTGIAVILGRRFCAAPADHGANVVAGDLDRATTEELAAAPRARHGAEALGVACGVTSEEAWRVRSARRRNASAGSLFCSITPPASRTISIDFSRRSRTIPWSRGAASWR